MYNEAIYISPKYKLGDYQELFKRLKPNSNFSDWEQAIKIFQDRIHGRFLDTIMQLKQECEGDSSLSKAFSIMAINCLLIETLQQFYDGLDNFEGKSRKKFKEFLANSQYFNGKDSGQFRQSFNKTKAGTFYSNVRCGILHQAQTKGNTVLTYYNNCLIDDVSTPGVTKYDVKLFTEALIAEYEQYILVLRSNKDIRARENFCKKWGYIIDRNLNKNNNDK